MHHLSPRSIAALVAVSLALEFDGAPLAPIGRMRNPDPRPFAKREEGRARRDIRRQVRAAKSSWLNS